MSSDEGNNTVVIAAGQAAGIFFVGLRYQMGRTSSILGSVGQDAKYGTDQIIY